MAITNFIPTIWSETLSQALEKEYIGVAHCNRDFEGEIKEKGNVVKVCGLENVTVRDYSKNSNMEEAETLSDFSTDLRINHAKYFNFQIDDLDRVQASPKLMELAIHNAAAALAAEAEKAVFGLVDSATLTFHHSEIYTENILEQFLRVRNMLQDNNVNNSDDIVIEVPPFIGYLITKAKLATMSDNTSIMETGCIGSIAGCKVYVTKDLPSNFTDVESMHTCIMRTKRAVAFAEQLSEIQAYRPERRFADAVKGLHLYGCEIIHPNEFVKIDFTVVESFSN